MRPNDMRLLVLAGLIAASPAVAATGGEAKLEKALAGKVAGKPVDCIRPDLSARPEIYDSAGIIYRDARITYVARMEGRLPRVARGSYRRRHAATVGRSAATIQCGSSNRPARPSASAPFPGLRLTANEGAHRV
jgi:hypothetical protein